MGSGKRMTTYSTHEPRDLVRGRTALVTGAGNGLGRSIALALAGHGARLILTGRRAETLEAVAGEISDGSGTVDPVVARVDTSSVDSVDALAAAVADEDISVLINNAGVAGPIAPLWEIDPADWRSVQSTNVDGVFHMCRAFLPRMIERGDGDIVNLASVSGKRPLARRTPYTSSKMAVIGLTTTLAFEVGHLGIRVNTLSPGPVDGPRMARNFALEAERTGTSVEEAEQAFVGRAAMQRMVTEDEVGAAVVAILHMPGLCGADIDLSAGMAAR